MLLSTQLADQLIFALIKMKKIMKMVSLKNKKKSNKYENIDAKTLLPFALCLFLSIAHIHFFCFCKNLFEAFVVLQTFISFSFMANCATNVKNTTIRYFVCNDIQLNRLTKRNKLIFTTCSFSFLLQIGISKSLLIRLSINSGNDDIITFQERSASQSAEFNYSIG